MQKCASDVDDVMSSITGVKGEQFARILALHINFTTLVSLSGLLNDDLGDARLNKMIQHVSVLVSASTLSMLSELANLGRSDVDEIIQWGERLHNMINSNIQQLRKDTE
jgi:hypothetical protein